MSIPDEAKKLLAEAGYPDSFKTTVLTTSTYVDVLSVLQGYLAKVGIDMEIDGKELEKR